MHETAMTQRFTTIIEPEDDTHVALCAELDIASKGESISQARNKLRKAIELFLECKRLRNNALDRMRQ